MTKRWADNHTNATHDNPSANFNENKNYHNVITTSYQEFWARVFIISLKKKLPTSLGDKTSDCR